MAHFAPIIDAFAGELGCSVCYLTLSEGRPGALGRACGSAKVLHWLGTWMSHLAGTVPRKRSALDFSHLPPYFPLMFRAWPGSLIG